MASHPVCRCSPPPGEYFPGGRERRERRRERKKHYWDIMAETQRWAAAAWVHPRNQQSRLMAVSGVMAAIKLFSSLLGLPFRCKMIESTAREPRSIFKRTSRRLVRSTLRTHGHKKRLQQTQKWYKQTFKKAFKDILHVAPAAKDGMRENVSSFLAREFICAKCKDTSEPVINQEQFDREKINWK